MEAALDFEVKKPNGSQSALVMVDKPTPMDLLSIAVSQNFDIEKLAKLMELQKEWERNEARKAFQQAKAEFKSESIHITRDKENKQYSSRYTSIGNLIETVTPYLSKHGLSVDWEVDQSSGIKVTCNLTHRLGYGEARSMVVPPDASGQKNPIQQIKSAITYARICTFECATGLASRDPQVNPNDDGNGFDTPGAGLPDQRFVELRDWIDNSKDDDELKRMYQMACKEADAVSDAGAKREFNKAKNNKYRELHNAGR